MKTSALNVDVVQVAAPQVIAIPPCDEFGRVFFKPLRVEGHLGVEIIVAYGSVTTTGAVEFIVQDGSASDGAFTSVANMDLAGTEDMVSIPAASVRTSGVDQNCARRIGYRGAKPWVRVGFKSRFRANAQFVVVIDAILVNVP